MLMDVVLLCDYTKRTYSLVHRVRPGVEHSQDTDDQPTVTCLVTMETNVCIHTFVSVPHPHRFYGDDPS